MKLTDIMKQAKTLIERVTAPDYEATARDVAESQELVNQYIDELERLENTATVAPYLKGDDVADKVLSRWYPNV